MGGWNGSAGGNANGERRGNAVDSPEDFDMGAGPDGLRLAVVTLVHEVDAAVEQLIDLPIGQVGAADGHVDDVGATERGLAVLRAAARKMDLVFAEFANAVVVNQLHKRDGGRATARTYLKRLFDLTDTESRQLLMYRDTLYPEPDPDPPPDAGPEETAAKAEQHERRAAVGQRLATSARKGNFPVGRAAQMGEVIDGFRGQEAGLMEEVAEAIADNVDSTPAGMFRSMCTGEARSRLEKRKSPTKAGTSQARLTVRAPDVNGLCKLDAMLPAPTAAVLNALLHLNAGPGAFLELPEGVNDPRTLTQRRVHALHHVLLSALQQSAEGVGGAAGEGPGGSEMRGSPEDEGRGLLRWLRTESTWWDPDRCPFVADLYSGRARPIARANPAVASIVVSIRASDLDEELRILDSYGGRPDGAPPDGAAADGGHFDGFAPDGVPPDGASPGGAASDWRGPADVRSEAPAQEGTPSGTSAPAKGPCGTFASGVMGIPASGEARSPSAGEIGDDGSPPNEEGGSRCGRGFRRFPTNTGIDVTLPELAALGSHRYTWLALLDDITGRPLDLGRSRRTADLWQRILLLAAETVSTYPGCEQPADACQTHHIDAWLFGGLTDMGNCTLRCPEHHRENDDADVGDASGRATHPRETGRVGHVKPGQSPEFNDSPAARRSPGWSDTWWATYQSERREMTSTSGYW